MKPTWVIGELGQIGGALVGLLGDKAIAPSLEALDLSFPDRIRGFFDQLEARTGTPLAVISAAAYTQVDKAEADESLAMTINAEAPGEMARWCQPRAVPLVHYSTDYVYPGTGTAPWREDDATEPLNAYGRTKLAGDRQIAESGAPYLIFRTCWVYDARGANFFKAMLRLAAERDTLRVVADQIGAPSYAPHLARMTLAALNGALQLPAFPAGVYHMANEGETSWHGFAQAICATARNRGVPLKASNVEAILTADYPTAARRPLNSRLDKSKLTRVLGVRAPHWQAGLDECMDAWIGVRQ